MKKIIAQDPPAAGYQLLPHSRCPPRTNYRFVNIAEEQGQWSQGSAGCAWIHLASQRSAVSTGFVVPILASDKVSFKFCTSNQMGPPAACELANTHPPLAPGDRGLGMVVQILSVLIQ